MDNNIERRSSIRFDTTGELIVQIHDMDAAVRNLSLGGMHIEAPHHLPSLQYLQNPIFVQERTPTLVRVPMSVCWKRTRGKTHAAGLRFDWPEGGPKALIPVLERFLS